MTSSENRDPAFYYTQDEVMEMNFEEFSAAKENDWRRPEPLQEDPGTDSPSTTGEPVGGATIFPAPLPPQRKEHVGPATPPKGADDPYAPTSWGKYDEGLTVGSGQRCRVRKLDLEDVMETGLVDRLNTLQGVVDKSIRKGKGQPPLDPIKLMSDKRTATEFSSVVNTVVCKVVTAPTVHLTPEDPNDRQEGLVYVDTISLTDKIEIFEFSLGELKNLQSFRGKSDKPAQRVDDGESDVLSSE